MDSTKKLLTIPRLGGIEVNDQSNFFGRVLNLKGLCAVHSSQGIFWDRSSRVIYSHLEPSPTAHSKTVWPKLQVERTSSTCSRYITQRTDTTSRTKRMMCSACSGWTSCPQAAGLSSWDKSCIAQETHCANPSWMREHIHAWILRTNPVPFSRRLGTLATHTYRPARYCRKQQDDRLQLQAKTYTHKTHFFLCKVQPFLLHLRLESRFSCLAARDAGSSSILSLRNGGSGSVPQPRAVLVKTSPHPGAWEAFGCCWHWRRKQEDIYFQEQMQTQGIANWPKSNTTWPLMIWSLTTFKQHCTQCWQYNSLPWRPKG